LGHDLLAHSTWIDHTAQVPVREESCSFTDSDPVRLGWRNAVRVPLGGWGDGKKYADPRTGSAVARPRDFLTQRARMIAITYGGYCAFPRS